MSELDTRSQMAVNLCAKLDESTGEKFRTLAFICKSWGLGVRESMPLAHALREKLGLNELNAGQSIRAVIDGQEVQLNRRN